MRELSDTIFFHSVCPTCAKEFYGDLLEEEEDPWIENSWEIRKIVFENTILLYFFVLSGYYDL